jgi:hypothetical protein
LQLEDAPPVDSNSLETAVSVQDTMVEHVDVGLFLGNQVAVKPDLQAVSFQLDASSVTWALYHCLVFLETHG